MLLATPRHMLRISWIASCAGALLLACGSEIPEDQDGGAPAPGAGGEPTVFEGGRIDLPECGHAVVTRPGASAPRRGEALLGPAPAPRRIHLSLAGPPTSSIVVQWSTEDQTTRTATVEYGKENLQEHVQEGLSWVYPRGPGTSGLPVR